VLAALSLIGLTDRRSVAGEVNLHVDGMYHLNLSSAHGNKVEAHAEGYLYLDDGTPPLHFTIDTIVKGTGDGVEGTPTMVFDDGSTLTFYYEVRNIHGTIDFEGEFEIVEGTGLFDGASGSGEICYPIDGSGGGPLMMDGTLIR
jgi:hypothetical protein